jgi:DNA-binding CsgD family transcriptional regulator
VNLRPSGVEHRINIYAKLDVHTRTAAVARVAARFNEA